MQLGGPHGPGSATDLEPGELIPTEQGSCGDAPADFCLVLQVARGSIGNISQLVLSLSTSEQNMGFQFVVSVLSA